MQQSVRHVLLSLVHGALVEDGRPKAEPLKGHLDGRQGALAQNLGAIPVEQCPTAHHAQERHCQRGKARWDTSTAAGGTTSYIAERC